MVYRRILLPLDTGGVPDAVARHVFFLAASHKADVFGLRIIPVVSSGEAFFDKIQTEPGSRGARLREDAQAAFSRLARLGKDAGVRFSGEVVFTERGEADAIVEYAAAKECDLIVMPTYRRAALSRWLMGNVEDKVRRRAPVPVLFVPVAQAAST